MESDTVLSHSIATAGSICSKALSFPSFLGNGNYTGVEEKEKEQSNNSSKNQLGFLPAAIMIGHAQTHEIDTHKQYFSLAGKRWTCPDIS